MDANVTTGLVAVWEMFLLVLIQAGLEGGTPQTQQILPELPFTRLWRLPAYAELMLAKCIRAAVSGLFVGKWEEAAWTQPIKTYFQMLSQAGARHPPADSLPSVLSVDMI